MMSGVMACLVIGFDMVTKGPTLEWMIFVLGRVFMIAGIWVSWKAGKLFSDQEEE